MGPIPVTYELAEVGNIHVNVQDALAQGEHGDSAEENAQAEQTEETETHSQRPERLSNAFR